MTITPDFPTLVDAALHNSERYASKVIFEHARPNGTRDSLTFRALDRKARSVARKLMAFTSRGDRILIPTRNTLSFHIGFLACLYSGRIAVPVAAPSPKPSKANFGLDKFLMIVSDCHPQAILWDEEDLLRNQEYIDQIQALKHIEHLNIVAACLENPIDREEISADKSDVAFLQYSSGSTSAPKGVMLTHHCIVHNQALAQSRGNMPADGAVVTWLPLYHDMGLCKGFFFPVYKGVSCTLLSPHDFIANPEKWLIEISRRKEPVLLSGGPNFAYGLCLRKVSDDLIPDLDLSNWKLAFNGAEPIAANILALFAMRFGRAGFNYNYFYPAYGLAEATLFVCGGEPAEAPVIGNFCKESLSTHIATEKSGTENVIQIVGCGAVNKGSDVLIIDTVTGEVLNEGHVGEIWVRSESIGRGYWGKKEETAETFNQHVPGYGDGFLRTGDLGFIKNEQLYISGRVKEMIIINGVNYYPHDIEWTITNNVPGFFISAAIPQSGGTVEEISIVVEASPNAPAEKLLAARDRIRQLIFEDFRLTVSDIYFVKRGGIPRTSSGKIQRTLCAKLIEENQLTSILHCNPENVNEAA